MFEDEVYNPIKDDIVVSIPLFIAKRKDISNLAKIVYGYLLENFASNQPFNPTVDQISTDLNYSRNRISQCLKQLREAELIKTIRTGRANLYFFIKDRDHE